MDSRLRGNDRKRGGNDRRGSGNDIIDRRDVYPTVGLGIALVAMLPRNDIFFFKIFVAIGGKVG